MININLFKSRQKTINIIWMEENISAFLDVSKNMSRNASTMNNSSMISESTQSSSIITVVTFLSVVCVLILLGNALVILAFTNGPRRLRTYTNFFVVNLAISDLMVGCLSVPFWICLELGKTSDGANKFFIALDILFGTTSILSLAAISLERMYAVKYPAHHLNLSRRTVYASIAFTWTIGIMLTVTNITLFKHQKILILVLFTFAFVIPLLVIIFSYVVLFVTAFQLTAADNQLNSLSREIQIAKTISVIIGLFVICWAPFFCLNIAYTYCPHCANSWTVSISITKLLHYSNSMMNFFVYAVRSPDFRQTFKALIYKCDTSEVRERLRTISFRSIRSRSSTLVLKRNNNNSADSSGKCEVQSHFLNVNYNGKSFTEETDLTIVESESPSIGLYLYDCMRFEE